MRPKLADEARARAEAIFNRREQQKVDAPDVPIATAQPRVAQEAVVGSMRELRRLRRPSGKRKS
jgi:hypothetical protein